MYLFCYGTLLDDSVWQRVTGRIPTTPRTAWLAGWRRLQIPGESYPGIVPAGKASPCMVEGGLREVINAEEWALLDAYEGSDYRRVNIDAYDVEDSRIPCQTYAWAPQVTVDSLRDHRDITSFLLRAITSDESMQKIPEELGACEEHLQVSLRADEDAVTLVGFAESTTVAMAMLSRRFLVPGVRPGCWMVGVWVRPGIRGAGIGKQMLRAAESEAVRRKTVDLWAWTHGNPEFFLKMGWERSGESRVFDAQASLVRRRLA